MISAISLHRQVYNGVIVLHFSMNEVKLKNVVAMVEKPIKEGRITGLKQWDGMTAIVVIKNGERDKIED